MHDYVIVGAGAAGCVIANRLSEDASARVLLLEAGEETASVAERTTAPQEHLFERRLSWPHGTGLGGSSALHDGIAVRGHPADYDGWADQHGCDGWSYAEVLPYFKRLETNARGASRYHAGRGPLRVSDLAEPHPITQALVRAAIDAGMPFNPDFNGRRQDGVGLHQVTQQDGQPHSAADAYLQPARHRENLNVLTGAHVRRIDFEGRHTTGVSYVEDGTAWSAFAEREVILCAGTVGSPHLLMLSGVGPAEHLEGRSISVKCDLAGVGRNLQDHLSVPVHQGVTGGAPSTSNGFEASVFFRTCEGLPAPNIQLYAAPLLHRNHGLGEIAEAAFTLDPALLHPASTGHLSLRPDDPAGPPILQPRYCSDLGAADLAALVSAIRTAREIFAQRPFDRFRAEELRPGQDKTTGAELRAYVRLEAETLYHPVGTCAMGTGAKAVVDPKLRVRGVEGLRVADASVMPRIVRGSPTLPTIMIGEKAADLIRGHAPPPAEEPRAEKETVG